MKIKHHVNTNLYTEKRIEKDIGACRGGGGGGGTGQEVITDYKACSGK